MGLVMKKKSTAIEVANSIIEFCNQHGDVISNLKLQKLLYYCQAWYLTLYRTAMFDEEFQAWVHGPVERSSYDKFKRFRYKPIVFRPHGNDLSERARGHIVEILLVYGSESALDLERRTHQEDPWIIARNGLPPDEPSNAIIKKSDMQNYYSQFLDGKAS